MNKSTRILSIVTLVLSIVLAIGALYLFHACGPMDDGSWMKCHWAQQISSALGAVLAVQSVIAILAKTNAARAAAAAAMVPTAVMAILVPNTIIPLCMMADMQCQAIMKPAVRLVAGVILVLAAVNAVLSAKADK